MFLELKDKFGPGCFPGEALTFIRVKKITPCLYLSTEDGGRVRSLCIHPQVIVTVKQHGDGHNGAVL